MIPRGARPWLLKDLAQRLGAAWSGDGTQRLERAAPLETADATALAAVYDRRLLDRARTSRAGALVVAEDLAGELEGRALIVSAAPKALFARAIELLHPPVPAAPGIHPSAVVAADA
ncbi:MAG: UDP-3-O-(3-hydroxymyristoyl)glucosamine N-acyltransferase, partial [Acidobacteria bacterium]